MVPDEAPPLDSSGRPFWPAGWDGEGGDSHSNAAAAGERGSRQQAAVAGPGIIIMPTDCRVAGVEAATQAERAAAAAAAAAAPSARAQSQMPVPTHTHGTSLMGPKRRVEAEADLFELLRIPYREPHQRNA